MSCLVTTMPKYTYFVYINYVYRGDELLVGTHDLIVDVKAKVKDAQTLHDLKDAICEFCGWDPKKVEHLKIENMLLLHTEH